MKSSLSSRTAGRDGRLGDRILFKDVVLPQGEACPPQWMPRFWARHRRQIMSLGLTLTAGFIDAIGYMILFHIYTANMSGNTISFGTDLAFTQWRAVFHAGLPIASFIAGLAFSTFLMELIIRRRWRIRLALVLGIEAALLTGFFILGVCTLGLWYPGRLPNLVNFSFLTILAAGAMGMQNASLTSVGSLSVTTTHVTGTLLKFTEGLMHSLFWLYDHTLGRFPRRWSVVGRILLRKRFGREMFLMGGMWICYFIGAVAGAIWLASAGLTAIFGPIAIVCLFISFDLIWPACIRGTYRPDAAYKMKG